MKNIPASSDVKDEDGTPIGDGSQPSSSKPDALSKLLKILQSSPGSIRYPPGGHNARKEANAPPSHPPTQHSKGGRHKRGKGKGEGGNPPAAASVRMNVPTQNKKICLATKDMSSC